MHEDAAKHGTSLILLISLQRARNLGLSFDEQL
jgi:hypothetical protein